MLEAPASRRIVLTTSGCRPRLVCSCQTWASMDPSLWATFHLRYNCCSLEMALRMRLTVFILVCIPPPRRYARHPQLSYAYEPCYVAVHGPRQIPLASRVTATVVVSNAVILVVSRRSPIMILSSVESGKACRRTFMEQMCRRSSFTCCGPRQTFLTARANPSIRLSLILRILQQRFHRLLHLPDAFELAEQGLFEESDAVLKLSDVFS